MSFKNKVVLITGAGSGIGEAAAIQFAKEGANVVVADIREEIAKNTAEKCEKFGNKAMAIKIDVSKVEDAKNAVEKTINEFAKLDVLVNNAGIARHGNILSGSIMDNYDEVMDTNLRSVIAMTNFATPYLIKTKGCVVNTSSAASKSAKAGSVSTIYAVSKAGVDYFTRLSAVELAPSGVRVNAVNPGPVRTNIMKHAGIDGDFNETAKITPLKRCSEPEEVADFIVYLASDKAKGITGGAYTIDNGLRYI